MTFVCMGNMDFSEDIDVSNAHNVHTVTKLTSFELKQNDLGPLSVLNSLKENILLSVQPVV